jgi:putative ABC transport system substrate-binding protein
VFFLLSLQMALAGEAMVVLQSDDLPIYDAPTQRFVAEMGEVEIINLQGDRERALRVTARLAEDPPPVIFALGAKSAWIALRELPDIPLIYAMVYEPERYDITGNITGVRMEVPPEMPLAQLQLMLPEVKRLGILLSEDAGGDWLDEALREADRAGYKVKIARVPSRRNVRRGLAQLRGSVDAIWLLPDREVLTPTGFQVILTDTLRSRIPLLAWSENLVTAGALMCVAPDYSEVGRQAAVLANRIIAGTTPSDIVPLSPESFRVVLNRDTQQALQLKLDPMLMDFVDEVVSTPGKR